MISNQWLSNNDPALDQEGIVSSLIYSVCTLFVWLYPVKRREMIQQKQNILSKYLLQPILGFIPQILDKLKFY